MWFVFALLSMLAWGTADLFYKKGANGNERYSHLKTTILVGFAFGIYAFALLIYSGFDYNPINLLLYAPVSLMYILSMAVGYFGLRYLDLSISSPIQNASGAVACLILVLTGHEIGIPSAVSVGLIYVGVILLGFFERKKEARDISNGKKKNKIGFIAFFMPILYCIIDSLGTALDGIYLDVESVSDSPLRDVTEENLENVANISYMLTFFIVGLILLAYLLIVKKETISLPREKNRIIASVCELVGQIVYVYAMSGNAVVAAPMIASYCVISVILSRIFLREVLTVKQYIAVFLIIAGIITLGVVEGLEEIPEDDAPEEEIAVASLQVEAEDYLIA